MTRQYKSTDEELREHEAQLQQRIDVNKIEIENLQKQKQEIEDQKKKIVLDRSDRKEKPERKEGGRALKIIRKKDERWVDSGFSNRKKLKGFKWALMEYPSARN